MGDRQFGAFTGQNRKIPNTLGGPIKLERFARAESQRKKGATPRCLALSLLIKSPVTGKRRNSIVGPSVAQLHQILMQPLAGSALPKAMSREAASLFAVRCSLFAVRRCLRDFTASVFNHPASLSAKRSSLLCRSGVVNCASIVPAFKCLVIVLRDKPVRREISRIDSFSRKDMRRIMFKNPM
jgi:hypothetical protein